MQIKKYRSSKSKQELTLENLHKITTIRVHGELKVKWLKWWNFSSMPRVSLHWT